MKVIVTVGCPASGKSTWAYEYAKSNPNTVIVCRDDLRTMQGFGEIGTPEQEKVITKIQNGMIEIALAEGRDVVVANTNINKQHRRNLIKLAHEHGADVEVKLFLTGYDECVRRNAARSRVVPEHIIRKMYDSMQSQIKAGALKDEFIPCPTWEKYEHRRRGLYKVVVCDLDGTIAAHNRSPYDYDSLHTDSPIEDVVEVIKSLEKQYRIAFVSGRPDSHKLQTIDWLERCLGTQYFRWTPLLFMRKAGDARPDYIVKNEIYDEHLIPNYDIVMAFDDRNQVVRHIRNRGITVAQVSDGRF